uniref:Uncharacterized protein n=1 Tax=Arundo donax TaxID=35708 RepID=A0A0A9D580_ARUDO
MSIVMVNLPELIVPPLCLQITWFNLFARQQLACMSWRDRQEGKLC